MQTLKYAVFGALAAIIPVMASAELKFCNKTGKEQVVAIGYKEDGIWVSEGWWRIPIGECKIAIGGDLKNRYYYYLAKAKGYSFGERDYVFCTQSEVFTIYGDEDCEARGYDKSWFAELDTGETYTDYTLNLED